MNDKFSIKYDIHFKTDKGNKYSLIVNGRKRMKTLLDRYESKMGIYSFGILDRYESKMGIYSFGIKYLYNGKKIENFYNSYLIVADFFKNEKIPTIFVKDEKN